MSTSSPPAYALAAGALAGLLLFQNRGELLRLVGLAAPARQQQRQRQRRAGSRRRSKAPAAAAAEKEEENLKTIPLERPPSSEADADSEYNDNDEDTLSLSSDASSARSDASAGGAGRYIDESRNLLAVLHGITEEQARKEGHVHRSITCNSCGTSPIRGVRFKCANCVDYDLCEGCEALEPHGRTHVFLKICIPVPPLSNARAALLPPLYPGRDVSASSAPGWERLKELQETTHFDQIELEAFYEQFRALSTAEDTDERDGGITRETFDGSLGPLGADKNLIAARIFAFFDQDGDELISYDEFVRGLSVLCKGTLDERIRHAFNGYDLDKDGFVSRSELRDMFTAYFRLSMELVRDVVKTMEEGMMDNFDDNAAKPVSAAFTAPIPLSDGDAGNPSAAGASSSGGGSKPAQPPSEPASPLHTPSDAASPMQHQLPSAGPRLAAAGTAAAVAVPPPTEDPFHERYPVMEAMSADAIEEMVAKTFEAAGAGGGELLGFAEFRAVVEKDTNLLTWFEALGSVF